MYSEPVIDAIISQINKADTSTSSFRRSTELFAIRQFIKEIPEISNLFIHEAFRKLITTLFGHDFFIVKSIYFDKPETSNWFVPYHQDLTISVDRKEEMNGYGPWTMKQNQFAVQPPLHILENMYTIRIHLDDTNEKNGALKVIPGSHAKGIYRPETIDWENETEEVCPVPKGGIMIMRPLLLHHSNRSTNNLRRRVIHIELCNQTLPAGLNWSEYFPLETKTGTISE